jgi:hypothetical protein
MEIEADFCESRGSYLPKHPWFARSLESARRKLSSRPPKIAVDEFVVRYAPDLAVRSLSAPILGCDPEGRVCVLALGVQHESQRKGNVSVSQKIDNP